VIKENPQYVAWAENTGIIEIIDETSSNKIEEDIPY